MTAGKSTANNCANYHPYWKKEFERLPESLDPFTYYFLKTS